MTHQDIPVVGGPFDGSDVPGYGKEWIGRVFEASEIGHVYRKALEDDGSMFWQYVGIVSLRTPTAV